MTYFLLKLKVHPFGTGKTLIFVNEIDRGFRLKLFLEQFGIKSCILNSELPFKSRHHIVSEFNRGLYDILIATDEIKQHSEELKMASAAAKKKGGKKKGSAQQQDFEFSVARGIDFINVLAVVNFDLPQSSRAYLHRIGRTARGQGNKGFSLSFVSTKQLGRGDNARKVVDVQTPSQKAFAKIKRKQASTCPFFNPFVELDREILSFDINMAQVDAFRYRVLDTLRSITSLTIREARLKEIRKQVINSEKLRAHFEDNPRDLEALVSLGSASHPTRVQGHLKIVPRYLLPVRDAGGNVLEGAAEPEDKVGEDTVGRVFFDQKKQATKKKRTGGFKQGGGHGKKARVDALKF